MTASASSANVVTCVASTSRWVRSSAGERVSSGAASITSQAVTSSPYCAGGSSFSQSS